MEGLGPKLDDVMLEFLNGVLMTACLDDGLVEISREIAGNHMEQDYILQDDEEDEHYNAKTVIHLRSFPHITMELWEIFEKVD